MMMKNRKKSAAFGLAYTKSQQFIAIMRETECINFVIEVTNIERKSDFFLSLISGETYEIKQERRSDEYADIVFETQLSDELEKTMNNIIKAKPEMISVYCSFGSEIKRGSNSDIILEFMLDENVFLFSCNHDIYKSLQSRIRKLLI